MKRNALIEQIKTYICPFLSLSQKHLYKCAFSHSLISPNTCCHSTFNIIFLREQKGESRHLLSLPDMSDIQGGEAVLDSRPAILSWQQPGRPDISVLPQQVKRSPCKFSCLTRLLAFLRSSQHFCAVCSQESESDFIYQVYLDFVLVPVSVQQNGEIGWQ